MAFDQFQSSRIGAITTFLNDSAMRWLNAAAAARGPAPFLVADLFEVMRLQWVANWDLWNHLTPFPGTPVMPTVVIQGPANGLVGLTGEAMVGPSLFGRVPNDFSAGPMQDFTGANTIVEIPAGLNPAIPPFTAAATGRFAGEVQVTMAQNAPAPGLYHGIVLVAFPGAVGPEPLAWVVVIAT